MFALLTVLDAPILPLRSTNEKLYSDSFNKHFKKFGEYLVPFNYIMNEYLRKVKGKETLFHHKRNAVQNELR